MTSCRIWVKYWEAMCSIVEKFFESKMICEIEFVD